VTATDVIAFRRGWLRLKFLAIGGGLAAVAIVVLRKIHEKAMLGDAHFSGLKLTAYAVGLAGFLFLLREAYRFFVPGEPVLTLGPKGITINLDGATCIDIPWQEVQDLTVIDVTTRASLPINVDIGSTVQNELRETYRNVTAVAVSQDFYDKAILPAHKSLARNKGVKTALGLVDGMIHHVVSKNGRGSGWSSIFIPRGDQMLVALHHSMLPVGGDRLKGEVEARWRAFRIAA
jgi:hypothetical protein